jgi:uncharacterized protein (TIGR02246 family)
MATRTHASFAFVLLVVLFLLARQGAPPQAGSSGASDAAVREVLSGLGAADKAADVAAVLNHYADDAMLLPPNAPVLSGQGGVRSFYEAAFQRFRFEVSFDADEIHVSGEWAFAQGFINGQFIPKGEGAPRKLHEKYLMVLHRGKDGWKIYRLIWNASEPPLSAPK